MIKTHVALVIVLLLCTGGCTASGVHERNYRQQLNPVMELAGRTTDVWNASVERFGGNFLDEDDKGKLELLEAHDRAIWQLSFGSKRVLSELEEITAPARCKTAHAMFYESVEKTVVAAELYGEWISSALVGKPGQPPQDRIDVIAVTDTALLVQGDEILQEGDELRNAAADEFELCS